LDLLKKKLGEYFDKERYEKYKKILLIVIAHRLKMDPMIVGYAMVF
jgi:hypothetical protein